jgi:hypothetical protein
LIGWRPPVRFGGALIHGPCDWIKNDLENAYGIGPDFRFKFAAIFVLDCEFAAHGIPNRARNADAAGGSQSLETRCEIDSVTEHVTRDRYHVAGANPNAQTHLPILGRARPGGSDARLNFNRSTDRIHRTVENADESVTGPFDDGAVVPCRGGTNNCGIQIPEAMKCIVFILLHKARVRDDVRH